MANTTLGHSVHTAAYKAKDGNQSSVQNAGSRLHCVQMHWRFEKIINLHSIAMTEIHGPLSHCHNPMADESIKMKDKKSEAGDARYDRRFLNLSWQVAHTSALTNLVDGK